MKKYLIYLQRVLYHKWLIAKIGAKVGLPLLRILVHDIDKFYPDEFFAHAKAYANRGDNKYAYTDEFCHAAILHRHRNPHHWQYYILITDEGAIWPINIPQSVVLEMVVDWVAAAKTNDRDVSDWYFKNQSKMILHPDTRIRIEETLRNVKDY